MANAQTYRRQFKKTFEIVDKVASEYYELLEEEKIWKSYIAMIKETL